MPQIGFKEPQAFLNRLQSFFLGRIVFKLSEVGVGLRGKNEFGHGRLFGILGEGPPFAGPFLSETGQVGIPTTVS